MPLFPENGEEQESTRTLETTSLNRHRVANARLQNLRMAAAARYRYLSTGRFPAHAGEFDSLLPDGLPEDPFGKEPMRFLIRDDDFYCYSIGPDFEDGQAMMLYDPTNGTVSRGDIIVRVPREREYPFPREGVRAANAEDFRRQFPNGLPLDPFGRWRSEEPDRLRISDTVPVYVYSVGPNLDADAPHAEIPFSPETHYDPTNGTVSRGDLFIRIPEP